MDIRSITDGLQKISGRKQDFIQILESGDIETAKNEMEDNSLEVLEALEEYSTQTHKVAKREDKLITDENGNFVGKKDVWKLPVPYQVYINEMALVFLYGRPVKWVQTTQGTDEAYQSFCNFINKTRFNSKIRQAKRLAGSETESAMLFRVYRDDNGKGAAQIKVLAKSKGDEIYTRFDQYENLVAFAWGYYVKEGMETVYHFDVFTNEKNYLCKRTGKGWNVEIEKNIIGKIPAIYFRQKKEWAGVEQLINREEHIASHTADTNDYFADPIAIIGADSIVGMPQKGAANKTLIVEGDTDINNVAKYLTWDNAPQSKKDELEWLESQILSKSFTPNITLETLKSVSQLSAKALKTVMMLADVKANKNKEVHDEMLDRTANLIKAIIGNVLEIRLKSQLEKMDIRHEWQEPFGEDVADAIGNLIKAVDGGILSQESGIEQNPLVKDPINERKRLEGEQQSRAEQQRDIFNQGDEDVIEEAD